MSKFGAFMCGWLAAACVITVSSAVVLSVYSSVTSDHFEIPMDQWECTEKRSVKRPQMIGKTMIVRAEDQCVEYKRVEK